MRSTLRSISVLVLAATTAIGCNYIAPYDPAQVDTRALDGKPRPTEARVSDLRVGEHAREASVPCVPSKACDDKNSCTKNDLCDSKGICKGTLYSCSASKTDCFGQLCDGKGGCLTSLTTKCSWTKNEGVSTSNLLGVAGTNASDVYFVGDQGFALKWNGSGWSSPGIPEKPKLTGMHARGTTLYAVGSEIKTLPTGMLWKYFTSFWGKILTSTKENFCGNTLMNAVSTNGSEFVAVGRHSISNFASICYGTSGTFGELSLTSSNNNELFGVWGMGGFAYAVGKTIQVTSGANVLNKWTQVMTYTPPTTLRAIWGSSLTDIWTVGDGGLIVRFNGSTWTKVTSPTAKNLRGLHGFSGNLIIAVGDGGAILRWNGSAWSLMSSGCATCSLRAVWGAHDSEIWAVGDAGVILRYGLPVAPRDGGPPDQPSLPDQYLPKVDAAQKIDFAHVTPEVGTLEANKTPPMDSAWVSALDKAK